MSYAHVQSIVTLRYPQFTTVTCKLRFYISFCSYISQSTGRLQRCLGSELPSILHKYTEYDGRKKCLSLSSRATQIGRKVILLKGTMGGTRKALGRHMQTTPGSVSTGPWHLGHVGEKTARAALGVSSWTEVSGADPEPGTPTPRQRRQSTMVSTASSGSKGVMTPPSLCWGQTCVPEQLRRECFRVTLPINRLKRVL